MLSVNPRERPDCSQLLQMLEGLRPDLEISQPGENYSLMESGILEQDLLGTINLPKDLKLLDRRLPKSNYGKKNSQKLKDMGLDNYDQNEGSRINSGFASRHPFELDQDQSMYQNPPEMNSLEIYSAQVQPIHDPAANMGPSVQNSVPNYHDNQRDYHDALSKHLHERSRATPSDNYSRMKKAYPDHDNIFHVKQADGLLRNRSIMDAAGNKMSLQQRIQLINSQHPATRINRLGILEDQIRIPAVATPNGLPRSQVLPLQQLRTPVPTRNSHDEYSAVVSEQNLPGIYSRAAKRKQQPFTPKPEWWG